MFMATVAAAKCKDPYIQSGAVVADTKHRLLGIGWAAPSTAVLDSEVEWEGPNRDRVVACAEMNALAHSVAVPDTFDGATVYVTSPPCADCVRNLMIRRIRRVVYGPGPSRGGAEQDLVRSRDVAKRGRMTLERSTGNLNWVRDWMETISRASPEMFQLMNNLPL
jgi:deoxycytidylate deaminase